MYARKQVRGSNTHGLEYQTVPHGEAFPERRGYCFNALLGQGVTRPTSRRSRSPSGANARRWEQIFAPTGRRAVATGGVRRRRTEPVETGSHSFSLAPEGRRIRAVSRYARDAWNMLLDPPAAHAVFSGVKLPPPLRGGTAETPTSPRVALRPPVGGWCYTRGYTPPPLRGECVAHTSAALSRRTYG